ncbi:MAG: chemotaxis protein CheW [Thiotrichaceae bacterium]
MLTSYDLLVGLALLHERNKHQKAAISGWGGVLAQVANKKVLVERDCLKEIVSSEKVTRVIDHRRWLVGLMSYEGAIIPLVELRMLMNEENPTLGLKDRSVVVISQQNGNIGLLVDKVIGSCDYWSDDTELSDIRVSEKGFDKVSFSYKKEKIEVFDIEELAATIGIRREVVNATA